MAVHPRSEESPPPDAPMPHAFQYFTEAGHKRLVGLTENVLMMDRWTSPSLSVFTHDELWRWAHDQSQAVMGWRPLPFLDGREAQLLWTQFTHLGAISGAVVQLESHAPTPARGQSEENPADDWLYRAVPGPSDTACALRGQIRSLMTTHLAVRIVGPHGTGKAHLAEYVMSRHTARENGRLMDPLVLDGATLDSESVWQLRLHDAMQRGRPLKLLRIDRIPDRSIHRFLPELIRAREQRIPLVATHDQELSDFAARLWSRVFRDTLRLVSLNQRPEDIVPMAEVLWEVHRGASHELKLTACAARALTNAHWTGNVAELEVILMAARERTAGDRLEQWHLNIPQQRGVRQSTRWQDAEYATIMDALRRCQGNKSAAAELLGLSRSTLYRKLRASEKRSD